MTAPKKDPFAAKAATESKPTAAAAKADAKAAEKQTEAEDKVIAEGHDGQTPKEEAQAASTNPDLNAPDHDAVKTESTTQETVKRAQTDGGTATSVNTADGTQAPAKAKKAKSKTASEAKSASTSQIKREQLPVTIPAGKDGTYSATVQAKLGTVLVSVRADLWVGEAPLNVSLEEAEEIHTLLGEVLKQTKELKG